MGRHGCLGRRVQQLVMSGWVSVYLTAQSLCSSLQEQSREGIMNENITKHVLFVSSPLVNTPSPPLTKIWYVWINCKPADCPVEVFSRPKP